MDYTVLYNAFNMETTENSTGKKIKYKLYLTETEHNKFKELAEEYGINRQMLFRVLVFQERDKNKAFPIQLLKSLNQLGQAKLELKPSIENITAQLENCKAEDITQNQALLQEIHHAISHLQNIDSQIAEHISQLLTD